MLSIALMLTHTHTYIYIYIYNRRTHERVFLKPGRDLDGDAQQHCRTVGVCFAANLVDRAGLEKAG